MAGAFDGDAAGLGFDVGEGVDQLFAAGCDVDGTAGLYGVGVVAGEVEESLRLCLCLCL